MLKATVFAADAGEKASEIFPLFDPANAPTLLIWGVLVFLVSYLFLAPRLMSRSEEFIQDRENTVKNDLAQAEEANAKAAELLSQYEEKLSTARADASSAVRTVLDDADKKAIAAENRVSKKIVKQAADADDRIREATAAAAADLADTAAETAQATVARLAGLKVTKTIAKNAVKASAV